MREMKLLYFIAVLAFTKKANIRLLQSGLINEEVTRYLPGMDRLRLVDLLRLYWLRFIGFIKA